jgi:hypothetical protein
MSFGFGFGFTKITAAIRAASPPAFSPASLFANNEPGVWLDPSDFSTMFQDAAGTVPVTAVEQPVGRILDKSGRGFHATQTTATSRPVLRQDGNGKHYLYFDGVDDLLVTPTITPGVDKVQVFAGVRKLSDPAGSAASLCGSVTDPGGGNNGHFEILTSDLYSKRYFGFISRGSVLSVAGTTSNSFASPKTLIASGIGDISGDKCILRFNGAQAVISTTDQGTGNYGNYPLYIGRRGGTSLPFNGHLYSLIVRFGSNLPINTIEQAEAWINDKTGAY